MYSNPLKCKLLAALFAEVHLRCGFSTKHYRSKTLICQVSNRIPSHKCHSSSRLHVGIVCSISPVLRIAVYLPSPALIQNVMWIADVSAELGVSFGVWQQLAGVSGLHIRE